MCEYCIYGNGNRCDIQNDNIDDYPDAECNKNEVHDISEYLEYLQVGSYSEDLENAVCEE